MLLLGEYRPFASYALSFSKGILKPLSNTLIDLLKDCRIYNSLSSLILLYNFIIIYIVIIPSLGSDSL